MYWREAGLTYLQLSRITSRLLRQALKKEKQADFSIREQTFIKKIEKKEN